MISAVVLCSQPDARLVALAADGSEAAFEAIVRRYRPALLSYCRRLLLSESRTEDVVQQAILSAWTSLNLGTEVRQLQAWLYRITHNHAIDALRRDGYDFDELNESLRGADAPEFDLERRTLMRETLAAVAALPELQREAILRTAVEGRSYEEVESALGVTDTAVRGLVYRARASVRTCLGALAPPPLVLWAASQSRRTGALSQLAEIFSTGGSAGGAAAAIKSATILATSVAVVGGSVGAAVEPHAGGIKPRTVPARRVALVHSHRPAGLVSTHLRVQSALARSSVRHPVRGQGAETTRPGSNLEPWVRVQGAMGESRAANTSVTAGQRASSGTGGRASRSAVTPRQSTRPAGPQGDSSGQPASPGLQSSPPAASSSSGTGGQQSPTAPGSPNGGAGQSGMRNVPSPDTSDVASTPTDTTLQPAPTSNPAVTASGQDSNQGSAVGRPASAASAAAAQPTSG